MNPPEEFVEQYLKMRERMEWAQAALGQGQDVAQAKTVVEEFQDFYDTWRPVIKDPELGEGLDEARELVKTTLGRGLERIFLAHLQEVIEARENWWTAEHLFKLSVNFIALMKQAPPEMRPELERIHREHMQQEFDPETHYREAEAATVEEEANFRRALAGLEVDWPERVDGALRQRLETLDGTKSNALQTELAAQLEKLAEFP